MSLFSGIPSGPGAAALEYARRGLKIFPCDPSLNEEGKVSKKPLIKEGFYGATTEPSQILKWWRRWPDALIGYPTGDINGLFVLDLDRKHDDPIALLEALEHDCDARFAGPRIRTIGNGLHVVFKSDPRVRIGAGRFRSGVDWRGNGGYAIAPDGQRYVLVLDGEPEDAPAALIALIVGAQSKGAVLSLAGAQAPLSGAELLPYERTLEEWAQGATQEGSRHDSLIHLVWKWVEWGISFQNIMAMAPLVQAASGWSKRETLDELRAAAMGAFKKQGRPAEGAASAADLVIHDLDSLQSRDPPAWLIADYLPEGAFACLYGDSNTFKSFIALDMALAVAYGRPWQGRAVKQGAVLYVIAEGQNAFANRVRVWRQAHGLLDTSAPFYALLQPVQFGVPADLARLLAACRAKGLKPDWTWIDTLARNFGPGDPDKTQEMQAFVNGVGRYQAEIGGGIGFVHHAGKDPTRGARNSSVLRAAVDVEMRAEREEGSPRAKLITTKQKDAEQAAPIWLNTVSHAVIDPRTGEEVTSLILETGGADSLHSDGPGSVGGQIEQLIMAVLDGAGSLTLSEITQRVQRPRQNAHRALTSLIAKRLVLRNHEAPPFFWRADQYENEEYNE